MENLDLLRKEYKLLLDKKVELLDYYLKIINSASLDEKEAFKKQIDKINIQLDQLKELITYTAISNDEIELRTTGIPTSAGIEYLIYLRNSNERVGEINYRGYHSSIYFGDIGYRVMPEYVGNNYAYKALCLLSDLLAKENIQDFWITCYKSNKASIKIIEKYGDVKRHSVDDNVCFYECTTRLLEKVNTKTSNK